LSEEPGPSSIQRIASTLQRSFNPQRVTIRIFDRKPCHLSHDEALVIICQAKYSISTPSHRSDFAGSRLACPLEFGIYFSARKQHERPHPEPEQQDDDRAEPAGGQ
jgi:hypothetical protein